MNTTAGTMPPHFRPLHNPHQQVRSRVGNVSVGFGAALLSLVLLAIFAATALSQSGNFGARNAGLAGAADLAQSDPATSLLQPAALAGNPNRIFLAEVARLYVALPGNLLAEGMLGGRIPLSAGIGLGFTWNANLSDQLSIHQFILTGDWVSGDFAIGIGAKLLWDRYNTANFDPEVLADPLFQKVQVFDGTVSLGMRYQPVPEIRLALSGLNLTAPKMALEAAERSPYPREVLLSAGWVASDVLQPALTLGWSDESPNGRPLLGAVGTNVVLHPSFELRTGIGFEGEGFSAWTLGFSYRIPSMTGWTVDYAFRLPVTHLASVGGTSHLFQLTYTIPPPPERRPDLQFRHPPEWSVPPKYGPPTWLRFSVTNRGDRSAGPFSMVLVDSASGATWGRWAADSLPVDGALEESLAVPMDREGRFHLLVRLDDQGNLFPEWTGQIAEWEEENNQAALELNLIGPPRCNLAATGTRAEVSEVVTVRDEIPVVPLVFFASGSSVCPTKYDAVLRILAGRMRDTRDLVLTLRGFVDPHSDSLPGVDLHSLAEARSRAVSSRLRELMPSLEGRIKVEVEGYALSTARAGGESNASNTQDVRYIEDENRRVEITAALPDFPPESLAYAEKETRPQPEGLARISALAGRVGQFLQHNPGANLLIASSTRDTKECEEINFRRTAQLRDLLLPFLSPALKDRVYLVPHPTPDTWEGAIVTLNGDALLFKPEEGNVTARGHRPPRDQVCVLRPSENVPAGIRDAALSIVSSSDSLVRLLAQGTRLPDTVRWDFTDSEGGLMDYRRSYFARLELVDSLGQKAFCTSETLRVVPTGSTTDYEKFIVVQFVFNREHSESQFLENRIEQAARKLMGVVDKGARSCKVQVGGYTDTIGPAQANLKLSRDRAETELRKLRRYLRWLLTLSSDAELDRWLTSHRVTLSAKGFGWEYPYSYDVYQGGKLRTVLVGDNTTPEGRIMNRRVTIEYQIQQ